MSNSTVSNPVTVTDIDMPFMSMVGFMVKWTLASIPALFVLMILLVSALTCLRGILGVAS